MNVLIAEDDALTRLMLQRAVEHQVHACLVAQIAFPSGMHAGGKCEVLLWG